MRYHVGVRLAGSGREEEMTVKSTRGISEMSSRREFPGSLWGCGKIQFYLRVTSVPGDSLNPPSGPILNPTAVVCLSNREIVDASRGRTFIAKWRITVS